MRIVVVGVGRMGFSLAQELDSEGHEVSVVDPRADRAELAHTRLDVMAVAGSGCSRDMLRRAGAEDADLLLAVSGSDEVNIVSCLLARELGAKKRIARIESQSVKDVYDLRGVLGVDEFVTPRQITVARLLRILTVPGTTESAEFAGGRVILRAIRVEETSPLTAAPLSTVRELMPDVFLVTVVRRGEEFVVPTGAFRVEVGDVIYVVMRAPVFDRFLSTFKLRRPTSRRVFVLGASEVGLEFCARLAERRHDILLLEEDRAACERAAERLPRAVVIHGSSLDRDLLLDLNIGESTFFGLSDSVEANFAGAVVAKRLGADRAIVLASEPEQVALFDRPPIDAVVNPITLSVGAMLRSVRAGRVIFLFRLARNEFEALEIEAEAGSPGAGQPLRDVKFPRDAMVAAVVGKDGPRVATGDTVIVKGDHVIALARSRAVNEVVRLFSVSGAAPTEGTQT